MSVVSRQGFKYSIIGYFGFLIGTLSSIYVYPYDMEFYGTLRYVLATAELLFPFVLAGISSIRSALSCSIWSVASLYELLY